MALNMTKRPIDCDRCRKKASILYQEIEGDVTTYTQMCTDCPVLKSKLGEQTQTQSPIGDMCCVRCHTSLKQIEETQILGCSHCYTVFENYIKDECQKLGFTSPFHAGKKPLSPNTFSISERITDLTGALNQAITKENYEEAALLRDQIQELMSKPNESKD